MKRTVTALSKLNWAKLASAGFVACARQSRYLGARKGNGSQARPISRPILLSAPSGDAS
jgi:hypothetical protein